MPAGLKPVEEKKLLSLVLSARQTWPPPPPGTPDLAVTDAFATMQAQESAALRAQRQSQQRAMFNQPAASYHADHVHVDVPPGAPLSPGAVQSIAYERHLAGVPSNLPVPDPNGARPLSHSSYHHAASTSTSGGSLYGGGAMYTNQHHGGHNNSSMAVARPATSMSLIGVGDPVMPTSVAPELSPSSPMQVPRVFARPKSAAGSVSGRTTPTQSTGTSSPGRERGGGFSGNHNHGGASSVSRRSGAPASGTSSPARSSRAARISTASAPSPLSYRPTSPSPSSVRRSGGFKGGSQGGVAASDMGEGFLRTYENDILGAITSDDGRDPNAPSSPATYRSDPYQNEYGSYADYPVAPGSPSVASTSAYTAVTGLTSASAMAGAGGNLLQAPDFMSLNSGDLQELNELLRSLVIKQRRVSSAAAGGGGGGAAGSPGSGRASRAGSSRTSSPVRNGYGPASVSGSVAGSRAGAAAAAAAGPACVHLGDVTFSGPIATRGSLGFEVLVVRAHNLVLCNGTLLLSPNQGVVFLGSNITLRNVRIVCAQPSDRHGRRVDRGMVHVAESGSVRMHACTLQQSIGHPALLVTDSAAVELHECDITARRGDAIWVQGAGASLVGCGCHVHDVQGGVAMVVYRGGRASLSRSSITGGGKFAAIEVGWLSVTNGTCLLHAVD